MPNEERLASEKIPFSKDLSQTSAFGLKICEIPNFSEFDFEIGFTPFTSKELDIRILAAKNQGDDFKCFTGYFSTCWVPEDCIPMRSYAYFQAYCFMKANWKPYLRQIGHVR